MIITVSLIVSLISWAGYFEHLSIARKANAQIIPTIFGGIILFVDECTCNGSLLITVSPPIPGQFLYVPGLSMLHEWFQVFRPGPWVLGDYIPGGVCLMAGKFCAPFGVPIGTIFEVGTSL